MRSNKNRAEAASRGVEGCALAHPSSHGFLISVPEAGDLALRTLPTELISEVIVPHLSTVKKTCLAFNAFGYGP